MNGESGMSEFPIRISLSLREIMMESALVSELKL